MYEDVKKKFRDLEEKLSDQKVLANQEDVIKLSQEHSNLKKAIDLILNWETAVSHLKQNQDILREEKDEEIKEIAQSEIEELEDKVTSLKEEIEEELNPSSPNDKRNAIIEIRAGAGGDEAALFAADLFRMYSRYCELNNFKLELINANTIGINGFKEVIFTVKGDNAYGLLKFEAGTHRVQRVPETEKQGRVHTSTATVVVLPEAQEIDIEIRAQDIRIDTFCSSGPGGQSVNTTYSAIRIFHIPTGTTVSCQDEKSQHQNKEKALQVLRSRLLAKEEEERREKESSARQTQVGGGDRSDKVRTYNFPQDRVTDHRINTSWHSISRIMDGEIEEIILSLREASKAANEKDNK